MPLLSEGNHEVRHVSEDDVLHEEVRPSVEAAL